MTFNIDESLRLELTALHHAEGLYNAVDANREHLSAFLPWVDHMQSVANFTDYIMHCEYLHNQKKEVSFVIKYQDLIVGRVGLHNIDHEHKHASIGYWLTKNAEGKGIITRCCKTLIAYAFSQLALNRIEIKAAVRNTKSIAIAEKLHFTKEGIQRKAERINNQFVDLVMYSLIKNEWTEM